MNSVTTLKALDEFERRLRVRLAAKQAEDKLHLLVNEGDASLTLRLQNLTLRQNEAFDADTAKMQEVSKPLPPNPNPMNAQP
jgi:hypothetical protein